MKFKSPESKIITTSFATLLAIAMLVVFYFIFIHDKDWRQFKISAGRLLKKSETLV